MTLDSPGAQRHHKGLYKREVGGSESEKEM